MVMVAVFRLIDHKRCILSSKKICSKCVIATTPESRSNQLFLFKKLITNRKLRVYLPLLLQSITDSSY